jgi:hypothetical protein
MAGHVERVGERRNASGLFVGKPNRNIPLRIPDVGGWIILIWML